MFHLGMSNTMKEITEMNLTANYSGDEIHLKLDGNVILTFTPEGSDYWLATRINNMDISLNFVKTTNDAKIKFYGICDLSIGRRSFLTIIVQDEKLTEAFSITCSVLTMQALHHSPTLIEKGLNYTSHYLTLFANEFDKQTQDWDWDFVLKGTNFYDWYDVISLLAKQLALQILDESVPDAKWAVNLFLEEHFSAEYTYSIPLKCELFGDAVGVMHGVVKANSITDAQDKSANEVQTRFEKLNQILLELNLSNVTYSLSDIEISFKKK